jgi:hypothetical protein
MKMHRLIRIESFDGKLQPVTFSVSGGLISASVRVKATFQHVDRNWGDSENFEAQLMTYFSLSPDLTSLDSRFHPSLQVQMP